jgi:hypothetical protein
MKLQKRHLSITSITIMLVLAMLCYGGTGTGGHVTRDASHGDKYVCSHDGKRASWPSVAARSKAAVNGNTVDRQLAGFGGQIG